MLWDAVGMWFHIFHDVGNLGTIHEERVRSLNSDDLSKEWEEARRARWARRARSRFWIFFLWLDMWLIDPILGVQYIAIPYVDCQIANSDILIDWLWYHDARKNMRLKNCCSKLEVECCEVVMCCVDHKILFRIEKSTKRVASLSRCSRRTTHQAMTRSVTN